MAELSYDDYLRRLSVQDVLRDMGYVRNRKDGLRYPSFIRLDEHGQRIRGDKFIVTRDGQFCFHPPLQKNYNVLSLIKEHPDRFPEYTPGMNLNHLVNLVCHRLLNTPVEEKDREIREPARELKPFDLKDYEFLRLDRDDPESRKPFYPYFKHRGIDLRTQYAFSGSFVLASRQAPDRKGVTYRNLSFPLTVPGGDGTVVGFEERGRLRRDGSSPYKGKAAGSNASVGLWIASPAGTELKDAEKVYLFESAYDAMAYFQLHSKEDKSLWKAVFVSSGGTPTRGQMEGLIRTAPRAQFRLGFDNDDAGRQFAENFMNVAKAEKPYSEVALAYRNTPGHIEIDFEKGSAFNKLPKEVRQLYYNAFDKSEDYATAYLCPEDKEQLLKEIKEGYRAFSEAVDGCVISIDRLVPSEGYKDFNDELLGRQNSESAERKAVGTDLDGDGQVETEESNEEKHRYHR